MAKDAHQSTAALLSPPGRRVDAIEEHNESSIWTEVDSLLLPSVDEEQGQSEGVWSPKALGPGFIWIETGKYLNPPSLTQLQSTDLSSNLLQRFPLRL